MNNPLMNFFKQNMNPKQMAMNMLGNNINPQFMQIIDMAENNPKELQEYAKKICNEKGIDLDTELEKFKTNFIKR